MASGVGRFIEPERDTHTVARKYTAPEKRPYCIPPQTRPGESDNQAKKTAPTNITNYKTTPYNNYKLLPLGVKLCRMSDYCGFGDWCTQVLNCELYANII